MSVLKALQLDVMFTKLTGSVFIQGSWQMFIETYKVILYLCLFFSPKIHFCCYCSKIAVLRVSNWWQLNILLIINDKFSPNFNTQAKSLRGTYLIFLLKKNRILGLPNYQGSRKSYSNFSTKLLDIKFQRWHFQREFIPVAFNLILFST